MLRDLAVKLGCQNVEFLGHLTQTQLGEQMRCADIFFFPSIVEGHPQVLAAGGRKRITDRSDAHLPSRWRGRR